MFTTSEAQDIAVSEVESIPHNLMSLVKVMREFSSPLKTAISLPKTANCSDFWQKLASEMYYNRILEETRATPDYNYDWTVREAMITFADIDSLDVLTKKGRILKRLANHYKTMWGAKLPDNIQGIIGDRLQYYLSQETDRVYTIDFTDCIDWDDGMFGKRGSCWWGTYSDSVPTFQDGGGWAVRFYRNMDDTQGIGRTWIMPMEGVLVCFNSYGVDRPIVSKVIKQLFYQQGITLHYKAVEVENSQDSCIPYINSGTGFVLYPDWIDESEIEESYDLDLETVEDGRTQCCCCDSRLDDDEITYVNDSPYCQECLDDRFRVCTYCDEYCRISEVYPDSDGDDVCSDCARRHNLSLCQSCDTYHETDDMILTDDTEAYFCESCASRLLKCNTCDIYFQSCRNYNRHIARHENESREFDFVTCNTETVKRYTGEWTGIIYRHEKAPGLYIALESDDTYTISHEDSGLSLRGNIDYLWQAVEIINRLSSIDWTVRKDTLINNNSVMSTLRNTLRDVLN